MKIQFKTNRLVVSVTTYFMAALALPAVTLANYGFEGPKDTVKIELKTGQILIITQNRKDLISLQNYDINQMIRTLNDQLSDSVEYLEINDGKVAINNREIEMKDRIIDINEDGVRVKAGGIEVEVYPDDIDEWDDIDNWFEIKKETYEIERNHGTTEHFNVDLGVNNWLEKGSFPDNDNALHSIKPFGSWYIALNYTNRTWVLNPLYLEWGAGISWYNWKLQNADVKINEGTEQIQFIASPNSINGIKSKLTASYINVHLVPMFDFSKGQKNVISTKMPGVKIKRYSRKGFRFGLGGYAGYRLGSHTKFIFKENGNRDKDKERNNFYLQNFHYGVRVQLGWKGIELFGMYNINETFASGKGPSLNAIAFGLTL